MLLIESLLNKKVKTLQNPTKAKAKYHEDLHFFNFTERKTFDKILKEIVCSFYFLS